MQNRGNIFFTSFVLSLLIFGTAMVLNYSLDSFRLNSVTRSMERQEISYDAYLAEQSFAEVFGGNRCDKIEERVDFLKEESKKAGSELSSYGRISFFSRNEFDYLSRRYFLLQLRMYALIETLNRECGSRYTPIIFFYETDDDQSERQGYILSEIGKNHNDEVFILSLDKNYEKEPLIKVLVQSFNVSSAPTTIISGIIKREGIVYEKEIEAYLKDIRDCNDCNAVGLDFWYVPDASGFERKAFIKAMQDNFASEENSFAKADLSLAIARLSGNSSMICNAADYLENINTSDYEEKAIIYETIASLGCGRNRTQLLINASLLWEKLGVEFRKEIDLSLAYGESPEIEFETSGPEIFEIPGNSSAVIIGNSRAEISENDMIVSQSDRVIRDWLSFQIHSSPFSGDLLNVFSEKMSYNSTELREDIGWHEGARIRELLLSGANHHVASGTILAKHEGKWYAPDEKGIFRFEVPVDKVLYPTTRFLSRGIAVSVDTHGINMIVEQSVRKNATFTVGCGDHPGKVKAALHLAEKGINVVAFTDKYMPLAIGCSCPVFASPPISHSNSSVIIGDRPLLIEENSTFVVQDVGNYSNVQSYYDTPARYFRIIEKSIPVNTIYFPMDNMGDMQKLADTARFFKADYVAVRIFSSDDYKSIKKWLDEDESRKAVLFHSVSYPFGYLLMSEYDGRITFGDVNLEFLNENQ